MNDLPHYQYRGGRALVRLHEVQLREFAEVWQAARSADLKLPDTDDGDYASLETLLRHVLRAARGYMTWTCKMLNLPNPEIRLTPEVDEIASECDSYLEHLLERWQIPLANVAEEEYFEPPFTARWGVDYCIEAMLEHAVVHPMRHSFQLRELLGR